MLSIIDLNFHISVLFLYLIISNHLFVIIIRFLFFLLSCFVQICDGFLKLPRLLRFSRFFESSMYHAKNRKSFLFFLGHDEPKHNYKYYIWIYFFCLAICYYIFLKFSNSGDYLTFKLSFVSS